VLAATAKMITACDPGIVGVVVLLALGAVCCFAGYRYFRVSAGVFGFFTGMELAGWAATHQDWGQTATLVAGLLGGAGLATLFVLLAVTAVFGMGALVVMTLVLAATGVARRSVGTLDLVLAALVGGFAGLLLRRHAAIVATALFGGAAVIGAVFAFVKHGGLSSAVSLMSGPAQGGELLIFLLCVVLVVTGGLVTQYRYAGRSTRLEGKK